MKYQNYLYLATPFSLYPEGHKSAFDLACKQAAILMDKGINIYSPIAHSYPISLYSKDHQKVDWLAMDEPLVKNSTGLILLLAESWQKSAGMKQEMVWATEAGIPIINMTPGIIPDAVWDIYQVRSKL